MQYPLLISRVKVHPGINYDMDTHMTVFLDSVVDLTRHPLFGIRPNGPSDRFRPRSVPLRNLNEELPSDLGLEVESHIQSEMARADGNHNDDLNDQSRNEPLVSFNVFIRLLLA